jgi:hypothetical protein
MNDVEFESEESLDDDDNSESDVVYVFLTSSGNHDDTGETFDADDADDADDGSVDGADDDDDDDFEPGLENMLNIEFDADAGGFEFANDIFVCLLLIKIAKY